ncbi:hypothetical protein KMZ29_20395 [Bradyrhizobium sediminis]|uniref:CBS domain-containing protein n=1 Tax=Bradyrhizobium sediminis TaxID=2840469 RepID=A0A975NC32_9BRAD|nr:hypothetical protein [Bradyrhizobium sediminis]QWG12065.1 hypothetical protein KMZ29_20395 [Bradyrhizobium sediminis]
MKAMSARSPSRQTVGWVGAITDRDTTCRALADSGNLAKMTRQERHDEGRCMLLPEDDIKVAVETMGKTATPCLPVADSHKTMIGMLNLGDISHEVSKEIFG